MGVPCRYVLTLNKLLGIILASMGFGMLIISIIPWWGYILAFIVFILGIILIFMK